MTEQLNNAFTSEAYFIEAFRDKWDCPKSNGETWKKEIRDRMLARNGEFDVSVHLASDLRFTEQNYELFEGVIKDACRNLDRKLNRIQKVHRLAESHRTQYVFFPEYKSKIGFNNTILHMHGFLKYPEHHHLTPFERMKVFGDFFFEWDKLAYTRGLIRKRNRKNHQFVVVHSCRDKTLTEAAIRYATKQQHMEETMGRVIRFGSLADPL